MRRSSVITIILLVIVIIALVIALIVTNLPEKEEGTNPEGGQVLEENVGEVDDTPTYLALDSDIAKKMNDFLHPHYDYFYFNDFEVEKIQFENLTNFAKIYTAYRNGASEKVYEDSFEGYLNLLKKSDLDEAMQKVFGKVDYIPEDFMIDFNLFEYNAEDQIFYNRMGGGGGADAMPHAITGIYKIEEYADKYEVYSKYLYLDAPQRINEVMPDGTMGNYIGSVWEIKNSKADEDKNIAKYKDFKDEEKSGYESIEGFEKVIDGVEAKAFVKSDKSEINYEYSFEDRCKLLTKYYDQATEYKHTFMKNEDGTYYWVKSEIIK